MFPVSCLAQCPLRRGAEFGIILSEQSIIEFIVMAENDRVVLIGTYKKGQLAKWRGWYNYPISDKDKISEQDFAKIRRFEEMDMDWVSFVIANRNFERSALDHNLDSLYDIVVGFVADDKIRALMRGYRLGLTTSKHILKVLKTRKWRVVQYSFHTKRAVKFLKFKEAYHE